MTNSIEEKIRSLGIPEEEIPVDVEILTASSNITELAAEKRSKGWGAASTDQYLSRLFKPLYERDAAVQEKVQQELAHFKVPPDVVKAFFTKYSQSPLAFANASYLKECQGIPETQETRDGFVQEAHQLSLNILKEYLGVA